MELLLSQFLAVKKEITENGHKSIGITRFWPYLNIISCLSESMVETNDAAAGGDDSETIVTCSLLRTPRKQPAFPLSSFSVLGLFFTIKPAFYGNRRVEAAGIAWTARKVTVRKIAQRGEHILLQIWSTICWMYSSSASKEIPGHDCGRGSPRFWLWIRRGPITTVGGGIGHRGRLLLLIVCWLFSSPFFSKFEPFIHYMHIARYYTAYFYVRSIPENIINIVDI